MKTIQERNHIAKIKIREKRKNPYFVKKEKEYYKKWYKENGRKRKENYQDIIMNWIIHHPKEKEASEKLNRAIKKGIIVKPEICSICNIKTKLVGHHDNYDKPLEVRWICQSCHKLIHAKNKLPR